MTQSEMFDTPAQVLTDWDMASLPLDELEARIASAYGWPATSARSVRLQEQFRREVGDSLDHAVNEAFRKWRNDLPKEDFMLLRHLDADMGLITFSTADEHAVQDTGEAAP